MNEKNNQFSITWQFFISFFIGICVFILLALFVSFSSMNMLFNANLKENNRQGINIMENIIAKERNNIERYIVLIKNDSEFQNAFYYASEKLIGIQTPLHKFITFYQSHSKVSWILTLTKKRNLISSTDTNITRNELLPLMTNENMGRSNIVLLNSVPTIIGMDKIDSFGETIGYVVVGYKLDESFLSELQNITNNGYIITAQTEQKNRILNIMVKSSTVTDFINDNIDDISKTKRLKYKDSYVNLEAVSIKNNTGSELAKFYLVSDPSLLKTMKNGLLLRFVSCFLLISALVFILCFYFSKRLSEKINFLFKSLHEYQDKLQIQSKLAAIGQMSGMLAHDIRKPFSQIKIMLNMFDSFRNDPQTLSEGKKDIERAIQNVESMLNDIMDYSREIKLETKPSYLSNLLDFSIRQTAQSYEDCDIEFKYDFKNTYRPLLDDERMARVFSNIIGNAIEAITVIGKKKTGIITISVMDSILSNNSRGVTIILGNDGPPFAEDDIPKIFESFFTKGKRKGTGLGLASVKKIVELHSGEISARNRKDSHGSINGVEFVITNPASDISSVPFHPSELAVEVLPRNLKDTKFSKTEKSDSDIEAIIGKLSKEGRKFTVLLLEDEALYRASVKNTVKKNELLDKITTIYDAHTVDDAVKLLQAENITHAIVDIDLGEVKNGFDFLTMAKQHYPELNCMVHSNRHLDTDREKARNLGAKMFVSKPLDIEHLVMFLEGKEASLAGSDSVDRKVILYSDDEAIMRKYFETHTIPLKEKGYTVYTFPNGEELLAKLKELDGCSIVFTDQYMEGGMRGTDLIKEIERLKIPCRKFIVSGVLGDDFVREAKSIGAEGVFNPSGLTLDTVKWLIEQEAATSQ